MSSLLLAQARPMMMNHLTSYNPGFVVVQLQEWGEGEADGA